MLMEKGEQAICKFFRTGGNKIIDSAGTDEKSWELRVADAPSPESVRITKKHRNQASFSLIPEFAVRLTRRGDDLHASKRRAVENHWDTIQKLCESAEKGSRKGHQRCPFFLVFFSSMAWSFGVLWKHVGGHLSAELIHKIFVYLRLQYFRWLLRCRQEMREQ